TTTSLSTLSLHDALPICYGRPLQGADSARGRFAQRSDYSCSRRPVGGARCTTQMRDEQKKKPESVTPGRAIKAVEMIVEIFEARSEEHTSELQSRFDLVC